MPAHSRGVLTRAADGPDAVARYGDHADQLVDVHLPAGEAATAPVLVLFHGGFWRHQWDRRHTRPMAVALRNRGWVVATPEFRRTGGGGGWLGTFDDIATVREVLPRLLADATGRQASVDPLTIVGHSAGGQLAMWWALTAPHPASVRRVVALAPVADLSRAHADDLDDGAVDALLGGGPDEHPDRYEASDPARLLGSGDQPPITVLHGADDDRVPAEHSRGLAAVTLVELPGVGHFELIDPLSTAWPAVLDAL
ncbi:MAG TPA: alpha/beta hydrolase [Nocardioidaceae bacterium]|nr:alpha/beta hydrolase [Nocardioidaceae bacterium]